MNLRALTRRLFAPPDAPARARGGLALPGPVFPGRLGLGAGDLAPAVVEIRDAVQRAGHEPAALYALGRRLPRVYPHLATEYAARRASLTGIAFGIAIPEGTAPTPALEKARERLSAAYPARARREVTQASQAAVLFGLAPRELLFADGHGGPVVAGCAALPPEQFLWRGGRLAYTPTGLPRDARALTPEEEARLVAPHYALVEAETDADRYGGTFAYAALACGLAFFTLYEAIRQTERMGKPVRTARYPAGLDPAGAEVAILRQAVHQMGHDLGAVLPDDMTLEVLSATAGQSTAAPAAVLLDRLDAATAKLFNGTPMLTNESRHGTRAQAAAQASRTGEDLRWADIERAEAQHQAVLDRLWHLSVSDREPCPLVAQSDYEPPEDQQAVADTLETLVRAGLQVPAAWAYRRFGIPEPLGDEAVLGTGIGAGTAIGTRISDIGTRPDPPR